MQLTFVNFEYFIFWLKLKNPCGLSSETKSVYERIEIVKMDSTESDTTNWSEWEWKMLNGIVSLVLATEREREMKRFNFNSPPWNTYKRPHQPLPHSLSATNERMKWMASIKGKSVFISEWKMANVHVCSCSCVLSVCVNFAHLVFSLFSATSSFFLLPLPPPHIPHLCYTRIYGLCVCLCLRTLYIWRCAHFVTNWQMLHVSSVFYTYIASLLFTYNTITSWKCHFEIDRELNSQFL